MLVLQENNWYNIQVVMNLWHHALIDAHLIPIMVIATVVIPHRLQMKDVHNKLLKLLTQKI